MRQVQFNTVSTAAGTLEHNPLRRLAKLIYATRIECHRQAGATGHEQHPRKSGPRPMSHPTGPVDVGAPIVREHICVHDPMTPPSGGVGHMRSRYGCSWPRPRKPGSEQKHPAR